MTAKIKSLNLIDRGIDLIAVGAIDSYQKYLSPHKGYRCAHAVLHGGYSCSGYAKIMLQTQGWQIALGKTKVRFAECRAANDILKAQREDAVVSATIAPEREIESEIAPETEPEPKPSRRRNDDCCGLKNIDPGDLACCAGQTAVQTDCCGAGDAIVGAHCCSADIGACF